MSEPSTKPASEPSRGPDETVKVSELREFVFCERAWYLTRQGLAVSKEAQARRADGIAFHEARAAAAEKGSSAQTVWWIVLLVLAAIALLVVNALLASR
jgi:hypothetical protein